MSEKRYGWTQPCCDSCWTDRNPDREAVRLKEPKKETCVYCGQETESGVYVRIDPAKAPHPSLEK
jgi:hypothetical protein